MGYMFNSPNINQFGKVASKKSIKTTAPVDLEATVAGIVQTKLGPALEKKKPVSKTGEQFAAEKQALLDASSKKNKEALQAKVDAINATVKKQAESVAAGISTPSNVWVPFNALDPAVLTAEKIEVKEIANNKIKLPAETKQLFSLSQKDANLNKAYAKKYMMKIWAPSAPEKTVSDYEALNLSNKAALNQLSPLDVKTALDQGWKPSAQTEATIIKNAEKLKNTQAEKNEESLAEKIMPIAAVAAGAGAAAFIAQGIMEKPTTAQVSAEQVSAGIAPSTQGQPASKIPIYIIGGLGAVAILYMIMKKD